jgi:hypothetical protein
LRPLDRCQVEIDADDPPGDRPFPKLVRFDYIELDDASPA